ncbi:hypothetical protein [Streptomyces sp. NBC_00079]|uniref:hypothetical protein n=1 Tax=Streptomyces sp. NBC_00079 TaxID=2975644 RepID=UPI00324BDA70
MIADRTDRFEERLLRDLQDYVAQRAQAEHVSTTQATTLRRGNVRITRRTSAALAMGIAVTATVGVLLTTAGGETPGPRGIAEAAYTINASGKSDLRVMLGGSFARPDVARLQKDLRRLGAPVRAYVADPGCPTAPSSRLTGRTDIYDPGKSERDNYLNIFGFTQELKGDGERVFFIRPASVPTGWVLTLTFLPDNGHPATGPMRFAFAEGAGPACEPLRDPASAPSVSVRPSNPQ